MKMSLIKMFLQMRLNWNFFYAKRKQRGESIHLFVSRLNGSSKLLFGKKNNKFFKEKLFLNKILLQKA